MTQNPTNSPPAQPQGPALATLPPEIKNQIFSYLDPAASVCFGLTSNHFYKIHRTFHPAPILLDSYSMYFEWPNIFRQLSWLARGCQLWELLEISMANQGFRADIEYHHYLGGQVLRVHPGGWAARWIKKCPRFVRNDSAEWGRHREAEEVETEDEEEQFQRYEQKEKEKKDDPEWDLVCGRGGKARDIRLWERTLIALEVGGRRIGSY